MQRAGYSLIELLTVMVLISLLFWNGLRYYNRYQVRSKAKEVLVSMGEIHSRLVDEMTMRGLPLWNQLFSWKGWNPNDNGGKGFLIETNGNIGYYVSYENCSIGMDCLKITVTALDPEIIDLILEEVEDSDVNCNRNNDTVTCTYLTQ